MPLQDIPETYSIKYVSHDYYILLYNNYLNIAIDSVMLLLLLLSTLQVTNGKAKVLKIFLDIALNSIK